MNSLIEIDANKFTDVLACEVNLLERAIEARATVRSAYLVRAPYTSFKFALLPCSQIEAAAIEFSKSAPAAKVAPRIMKIEAAAGSIVSHQRNIISDQLDDLVTALINAPPLSAEELKQRAERGEL
jgi:hypothetical protein